MSRDPVRRVAAQLARDERFETPRERREFVAGFETRWRGDTVRGAAFTEQSAAWKTGWLMAARERTMRYRLMTETPFGVGADGGAPRG